MSLLRGADRGKDQSYFLFALTHGQLARALFPLGEMQKEEVRQRARQLALPVADRAESQDICFGDYRALVATYASGDDLCGGDVVDRSGRVLGRHNGIHGLTVGQRRGLGISAAEPLYVLEIEDDSKRVVVGGRKDLACRGLVAQNVNWLGHPVEKELEAEVQIRYRSPAIPCVLQEIEPGSYEALFKSAYPAVTPGQAAVFYRGDRVLGGGWIDRTIR
jgi:tRNA-uridine 2-sulfurtransferase